MVYPYSRSIFANWLLCILLQIINTLYIRIRGDGEDISIVSRSVHTENQSVFHYLVLNNFSWFRVDFTAAVAAVSKYLRRP